MIHPILRMLLWIFVVVGWVDIFLTAVTYNQAALYVVWPTVAVTALMVVTSERGRRWLS